MTRPEDNDDVALKLVHTADWHLGRRFPSFDEADQIKLSRARLDVIDRILGVAERTIADAVLCAGDLFDEPDPGPEWWEPLVQKLAKQNPLRPIFLLPGNHDPLVAASVYHRDHPFRRALPNWVHVVDDDNFEYELSPDAVLYAAPCRSQAGQKDLALSLPSREDGDGRIRIGLVHGSTFDIEGCQMNFPIARDAAVRRSLDYLAIGDTHSFREVPPAVKPPTVYPSAPEPTSFGEQDAGYVASVFITRRRIAIVKQERVAYWTWKQSTCRSLSQLRGLRDGTDLSRSVLRLRIEMSLSADEYEEVEGILRKLKGTDASHGRVGVLQLDRSKMELDTDNIENVFEDVPDVLRVAVRRLKQMEKGAQGEIAKQALMHIYRTIQDAG